MTTNPATRPFWVFVGSGMDVRRIGGIFMFNPGLKIGQIIKNADIVEIILKAKILRRINISGVN